MGKSVSSAITNFVERDFSTNQELQKNADRFSDFVNNLGRKTVNCFASRDTREIIGEYERQINNNKESYTGEENKIFHKYNSGYSRNPLTYNNVYRKSASKITTAASSIALSAASFSGGAAMAAMYNNSTARLGLLITSGIVSLSSGALVLCRNYTKDSRLEINEDFAGFLKDLSSSRVDVEELLLKTYGKYEVDPQKTEEQKDKIRNSFGVPLSDNVVEHIVNGGKSIPIEMDVKVNINWEDKSWTVTVTDNNTVFTEGDINALQGIDNSKQKPI
jgi:hypothetical protein